MAMNQDQYVAQDNNGWFVYWKGQVYRFNSQQEAEQRYIQLDQGSGGQGSSGGTGTGSSGGSSGGNSGTYQSVGGSGQVEQQLKELQQEYLRLQLEENKRQYDASQAESKRQFDLQLAQDQQKYGLSEADLAERRRQFDASQAENRRQFDASQGEKIREFDQSQQQGSQQFWANLMSQLSGPKDWLKYQIAQSQIPEGTAQGYGGDLMSVFNRTPAFGAMRADPGNSWEQVWARAMGGGQQGGQDFRAGEPSGGGWTPGGQQGKQPEGGGGYGQQVGGGVPLPDNTVPGAAYVGPVANGTAVPNYSRGSGAGQQGQGGQAGNAPWGLPWQGQGQPLGLPQVPGAPQNYNGVVMAPPGYQGTEIPAPPGFDINTPGGLTGPPTVPGGGGGYTGAAFPYYNQPATLGNPGGSPSGGGGSPRVGWKVPGGYTGGQGGDSGDWGRLPPQTTGGVDSAKGTAAAAQRPAVAPQGSASQDPASWGGNWQPIQISPSEYQRMTPTQRAMLEGQFSSMAIDPGDAWARMRAAWPGGYAQTKTQWR
ncbi:MAG: hypothetical protein Q7O66_16715 [Dehalococcoidia bacterium]|nr:hypothetical protein [Dehalococcoidia bacterium]